MLERSTLLHLNHAMDYNTSLPFFFGEFLMENPEDHPGDSKSLEDTRRKLTQALSECDRLQKENARLLRLLSAHGVTPLPESAESAPPHPLEPRDGRTIISDKSTPEGKIALFRSLFRGREDVYAVRWERPDGRSGYLPASIRDWKAVLSSKLADRKKVDKKTRTLLPLTADVIEKHLKGEHTIGIYPMLSTETCWFLAVDFAPGPAMEVTSGFSSISQLPQAWLASSDVSS